MSSSFLDHLGGVEKQRIITRLRSPEAYERLREKVKGPEDLERELDRAEQLAELHFALASNEGAHERLKAIVERSFVEQGIEVSLDVDHVPENVRAALEEGRFDLTVTDDALVAVPEGNVREGIPVASSLVDACVSQLTRSA